MDRPPGDGRGGMKGVLVGDWNILRVFRDSGGYCCLLRAVRLLFAGCYPQRNFCCMSHAGQ